MSPAPDTWVRWAEVLIDEGLPEAALAVADRSGERDLDVAAAYAEVLLGRPEAALARVFDLPAEPDPVAATLGSLVRAAARGALGDPASQTWLTTAGASVSSRGGHPAVLRLAGAVSERLGDRTGARMAWETALSSRTGPERALVDRVVAGRVAERDRDSVTDIRRSVAAAVQPLTARLGEDWPEAAPTMAGLGRALALLAQWGDLSGTVLLAREAAATFPPHPTTAQIRRTHRRAPGATRAERTVMRGQRGFGPPPEMSPPTPGSGGCVCQDVRGLRGAQAWTYAVHHLEHEPRATAEVAGLGDDAAVRRCPVTGISWLTGRLGYAGAWLAIAGAPVPAERTGMYL